MTAKRTLNTRSMGQTLEPNTSTGRTGATWALIGVGAALAPVAAGIAYSRLAVDHAVPLPLAIDADRRAFHSPLAGEISYYADEAGDARGDARPLLLVHSVNAGASAYEMRPLFDFFRRQRPVYALDLPGFGFSERSDRVYAPELFAGALLDLLHEIGVEARGGADVIALSLGCEFAARVAVQQPALIHSLALLSPTGFSSKARGDDQQRRGASNRSRMLHSLFAFPLWSQAFYDALVSRPSLRYFLQRSFVGAVDQGLLAYAWATTHQPGARFAPLSFVSGQLFTPNAFETLYARLAQPTLVIFDQDGFVTFDALPDLLRMRVNWQAQRVAPTRGLPQFERPRNTTEALQTFWSGAPVLQA